MRYLHSSIISHAIYKKTHKKAASAFGLSNSINDDSHATNSEKVNLNFLSMKEILNAAWKSKCYK